MRHTLLALLIFVVLSLSPTAAKGRSLLDRLLEVEAEHASLCQAALDAESAKETVDEVVAALRRRVGAAGEPESAIRALNDIVLQSAAIRPSQDLHDPCNLFLSSVMAQKRGYCVGVAGVYLVLAEELNLPLHAVSTPSHVFLRYDDGEVSINIDPSSQGAALPDQQYISQYRIAAKSIRKGVFLRPLSADQFLAQVHNNLGVVYSERKDYDAAAREYKEALRLDSHLSAAWYNQGRMLAEQKDFRGAVRSFSKALRLHPNDIWALNNRALAFKHLGEETKATLDFQAALAIGP